MKFLKEHHIKTDDGKRIYYKINFNPKELKPSTLLVFNYGLVCNYQHWSKQVPYFHKKGFSVLLHNYRGHFNSTGKGDLNSLTFRRIAKDIRLIVKPLKPKSIYMLGHSMGVNVTLEYARRYPTKNLSGLILISGTVLSPQKVLFHSNIVDILSPYCSWFIKTFPDAFNNLWKNSVESELMTKVIHFGGFNTKTVPEEFVREYLNNIGKLKPQIFVKLMDEMSNHNILNHLEKIKTPTIAMGGDKDMVIPYEAQKLTAKKMPHATFNKIKDGSHVPQIDFPAIINKKILNFIT